MNITDGSALADPFHPLIVVVEGLYDVGFLKHVSTILQASDRSVPDLSKLETEHRIAVVALGGGGAKTWSYRFASLSCREFHILDREIPPETEQRQAAAIAINCRPGCAAELTTRRGMENYLPIEAVNQALGIEVSFGSNDDVAAVVARRIFETGRPLVSWEGLVPSVRKRLREQAKRLLNTRVLSLLTAEQLERAGGADDFRRWFAVIAAMLD